ncbi:MAG TPA: hypothetical protein VMV14_09045 [Acidimicrobiales bacterium]|nr:hypothetical protein [Acidimicrobiales bacterium]
MRARQRATTVTIGIGISALTLALWAGVSAAISAGPNPPGANGCPNYDNASTFSGVYPGCHSLQLTITDGNGHTYAEAGTSQLPNNGDNYHSGTVMVTPNGDGNPYGTENGQPYGNNPSSCPTANQYTAPDPGQVQTDNPGGGCPQPAYPAVSGPGVGAGFDTNYQPLPPGSCGVEDIALYGAEWLLYVAGQSSHQCPFTPLAWTGPYTPLTDNPSEASQPFSPTWFTKPSAGWLTSLHPGWNLPNPATPPAVTPWVSTGTPNTTALDLVLTGGQVFLGGDDNGDSGEHDGTDGQYGSGNTFYGSSDGGAFTLDWSPMGGAETLAGWTTLFTSAAGSKSATSLAPIAENPFPFASFGGGACADGICLGAYTNQRTLYSGGGGSNSSTSNRRDVYNYQEPNGTTKDWGPYNCSSGSPSSEQACATQPGSDGVTRRCPSSETNNSADNTCGANYYRQAEATNTTSEPGVMLYADPDPQASPVAPLDPIPAAYVGTCGVVVGGGVPASPADSGIPFTVPSVPGLTAPAHPLPSQLAPVASTNSAGQVVAADPTGC